MRIAVCDDEEEEVLGPEGGFVVIDDAELFEVGVVFVVVVYISLTSDEDDDVGKQHRYKLAVDEENSLDDVSRAATSPLYHLGKEPSHAKK